MSGGRKQTRRAGGRGAPKDTSAPSVHAPSTRIGVTIGTFVIVIAGLVAYANSFEGVFLFDDHARIVESKEIRDVGNVLGRLDKSRPLVRLTLAANYAIGELDPTGYHAFNLAIHLLAGLTLFGLVRRTMTLGRDADDAGNRATWTALAIALLWVVHPLQTQGVTYVIQRAESMAALFYLLTLYGVARSATSPRARAWLAFAIVASALGMATKAIMVTAPAAVLLYDRIFVSGSFRQVARRWPFYAGLIAGWLLIVETGVAASVLQSGGAGPRTVGLAVRSVTQMEYIVSQPGVIAHYLRLAVWPVGLTLDYGWPVAGTADRIVPPALLIAALLAGTVWALFRAPRLGFVAAFFFIVLAPTSSIMPIQDLAVEHRMYLPLAAVMTILVLAGAAVLRRLEDRGVVPARMARLAGPAIVTSAAVLFIVMTVRRNVVYSSEEAMWRDVVARRPDNPRGYQNLGKIIGMGGEVEEAIETLERSLKLKENQHRVHFNLGYFYGLKGQPHRSIEHYERCLELNPQFIRGRFNLANTLQGLGRYDEAITHYRGIRDLSKVNFQAPIMEGNALAALDRDEEAIVAYRVAVSAPPDRLTPEDRALAWRNMGNSLFVLRRLDEAEAAYRSAIESDPRHTKGWISLARVCRAQQKIDETIAAYEAVLDLEPGHEEAIRELQQLRRMRGGSG